MQTPGRHFSKVNNVYWLFYVLVNMKTLKSIKLPLLKRNSSFLAISKLGKVLVILFCSTKDYICDGSWRKEVITMTQNLINMGKGRFTSSGIVKSLSSFSCFAQL